MKDTASDPRYRPFLKVIIASAGSPISLDDISRQANYSVATIKRHVRALKAIGVIEVQAKRGRGKCAVYRVDPVIERLVAAS